MTPPLDGVRVIEFGHDWACPHAARLLADFGAEVIKVEYPRRLDGMRGASTADRLHDRHPRFHQLNRNKRSATFDLERREDREAFAALVQVSDVLISNARAGVLERLGFGRAELHRLRPDLIVVSMTAFGESGPCAHHVGYGGTIEALSGLQSLTAYGPGAPPRRIREMDVINGIVGACAVLTALVERAETGAGRWIDLSQLEAATSVLLGEHLLELAVNGTRSLPRGNAHPAYAPSGCYPCRGDDAWVTISVRSDAEWRALCTTAGQPAWAADPRFATLADRVRHRDALDALIAAWTRTLDPREVMHRLQAVGVPAAAVLDAAALATDPHLVARAYFQAAADGSGWFPGFPFRLAGGGALVRWRGPDLGVDDAYVKGRLAGCPHAVRPLDVSALGTAFEVE